MRFYDYNERKLHGTASFPAELYYVDSTHPQYEMPAHWHKEFEIIKIHSGRFTAYLNQKKYILNSGDILIIEGGVLHRGEPESCIYECFVFNMNMLKRQKNDVADKYITPLLSGKVVVKNPILSSDCEFTDTVDSLLRTMSEKPDFYDLKIYSLLYLLVFQLYSNGYTVSSNAKNSDNRTLTVISLLNWIDDNFTDEITLKKISETFEYSEKYICRIFKEYTSCTLTKYINELRIEKACHEIISNQLSITQIAYDCGFNDLSYFCKIFKYFKNLTPIEYKKQQADRN